MNYQNFNEEIPSSARPLVDEGGQGEIELANPPIPRQRLNLPNPKIPLKKKMDSLQEQKKQTESKNRQIIETAILKRVVFRILLLIIYLFVLTFGFISIYNYWAFIKSNETVEEKSNFNFQITNCKLQIFDDLTSENTLSLNFKIPGAFDFWLDDTSSFESNKTKDESGLFTYTYNVTNILSQESCDIKILLGKSSAPLINNLFITCLPGSDCSIISYSDKFEVANSTVVRGNEVDLNLKKYIGKSFFYESIYGLAQINDFEISEKSRVNLTNGVIVLQSQKDYAINWTSGVPSYCVSAPSTSEPVITGCKEVKTDVFGQPINKKKKEKVPVPTPTTPNSKIRFLSQKSIFKTATKATDKNSVQLREVIPPKVDPNPTIVVPGKDDPEKNGADTNSTEKKKKKEKKDITLPPSCWGKMSLCKDDTCEAKKEHPLIELETMTGSIYANIISKTGQPVDPDNKVERSLMFMKNKIDWTITAKRSLQNFLKEAEDPKNFDPAFVIKLGSKKSNSSLYQQWVVTSNPAYSYLRPWWLGTFSFTLLNTATFELETDLNPGFCPYIPNLSQNRMYDVQALLEKTFKNQTRKIITFTHPNGVSLPKKAEDYVSTNYGFREVSKNIEEEPWINIFKKNSTHYLYDVIDTKKSPATKWAVVVSIIIASCVALYLVLGVVYGINVIYLEIIEIVTSTSKYSKIENKEDVGAYQPIMSSTPKKAKNQINEDVPSMSYNPVQLFRQLFVLAPPMSAFVDFLCVYMSKKYVKSPEVFYEQLFVPKGESSSDEELHDLQKEQISGTELKTLFEKFCYLNGYLEQKLDDEKNLDLLGTYGFKLVTKDDSLTQNYTKVILKDETIPKLGKEKKDSESMKLFIQNCCKVTKFDSDVVSVEVFNESYDEFCTMNHLQKENLTISQMMSQFGIDNKYLPQQWVIRKDSNLPKQDEAPEDCYSKLAKKVNEYSAKLGLKKELYFIDRKKMQNHFYLLLQLPEKIETPYELAIANRELINFHGWMVVDAFVVLFHIFVILILMSPILAFFLLEKVLYGQYSLLPENQLITFEDLTANFWVLPFKLSSVSLWIKILILIVLVFWTLGFIDLLYYYIKMEIPQDKFFRQTRAKEANFIQVLFRRTMWVLVLISFFILGGYVSLAAVWMMLGAIINPTAFLPYAAAAATFVTVVTTKYTEFMDIAENGLTKVIDFIKQMMEKELNGMLKKMNLTEELHKVVDSDTFKSVAGQAAELGLVDAKTLEAIEKNAENMLANPLEAAKNASNEMQKIMDDPGAFVADMARQMEKKAVDMMMEKIKKIIPGKEYMTGKIVELILSLFAKNDKGVKAALNDIIVSLSYEAKLVIPESILNIMWEFAFNGNMKNIKDEEFLINLLEPLGGFIAEGLYQNLSNEIPDFHDNKNLKAVLNKDCIIKSIGMINAISRKDFQSVTSDLVTFIDTVPQLEEIKKYKKLVQIGTTLLDGNKVNYHKLFAMVKEYLKEENIIDMEFINFIEILLNLFNHHNSIPSVRTINVLVEKFVKFLIPKEEQGRTKEDQLQLKTQIKEISGYVTFLMSFMSNQFQAFPKELLFKLINIIIEFEPKLKSQYFNNPKIYKNIIPVFQGVFETIGCFLTDPTNTVKSIENSASTFGIKPDAASEIKNFLTIKYEDFYPGKEVHSIKLTTIWKSLTATLQIPDNILIGIFGLVTMRFEDIPEVDDVIALMLKMSRLNAGLKSKFLNLYKLYASYNESDLFSAASNLSLPKEFISLLLVNKKILNPKFVTDEEWIDLGLKKEELLNKRYTVYNDSKAFSQWIEDVTKEIEKVNENLNEGGNDGLAKKALLNLQHKGPLSSTNFIKDLESLSNIQNKLAQMNNKEIEVIQSLINVRCINIRSSSNFDSDSKTGITELAKLINVEENKLEHIFSLIFLTKADKIQNAIKYLAPNFIETGSEENYDRYIAFAVEKMESILVKDDFIKNKFSKIFNIDIPAPILTKLIYNPNAKLDLNSMYELVSYPLLPQSGDMNFRDFDESLHKISPIMKYLSSHMEIQHPMLIRQIFNVDHEGVANMVRILNENNQAASISCFLEHINKTCEKGMLAFISLMTLFQGKSLNVEIKNKDLKAISTRQYLFETLGVYPELFEGLYGVFNENTHEYTEGMLKFFRRVAASKLPPNSNFSLQSLIKLPVSIAEAFLNFAGGEEYNGQILSKELGISQQAIDFGAGLTKIMRASEEKRIEVIDSVCSDKGFNFALQRIGVKASELLTVTKMIFGAYDVTDIKWIFQSLNLSNDKLKDETSELVIKSLLALNQYLKVQKSNKNESSLKASLQTGNFLLGENEMDLNKELVSLASVLLHGDFTMIPTFSEFPFVIQKENNPNSYSEYTEVLMGLCGMISNRGDNEIITDVLKKYYENLTKKPPKPGHPNFMKPKSTLSYAIYCVFKNLEINPMWSFLFMGDFRIWEYFWDLYYSNRSYQDPLLNPILLLVIVLNYIDTPTPFKEIMTDREFIKNYGSIYNDPSFKKITESDVFKKIKPEVLKLTGQENDNLFDSEAMKQSWEAYHEYGGNLGAFLWANWGKTEEKLKELAKKHNFPSKILDKWPFPNDFFSNSAIQSALKNASLTTLLDIWNNKTLQSDEDPSVFEEEKKQINDFSKLGLESSKSFEEIIESYVFPPGLKDKLCVELETLFPKMISSIYRKVTNILEDPRDHEEEHPSAHDRKSNIKEVIKVPSIGGYLEDNNAEEFTFSALSLIYELKNGYYNIHDYSDLDEDHYKLFTYKLDVLMTMIERNCFHKNFMENFSKFRVMQLVGLSAGFTIRGEDFVRANCTAQLNNYEFEKTYQKIKTDYQKSDFALAKFSTKMIYLYSNISNFKKARDSHSFRVYNLSALESAIENDNYYPINVEPENVLYSSYPNNRDIRWQRFIFDVPSCNNLMENNTDYYYEKTEDRILCITKDILQNEVNDLRSKCSWKVVCEAQAKWNEFFNNENFLLLMKIFKGDYKSILDSNSYFNSDYGGDVNLIYGLVGLSNSVTTSAPVLSTEYEIYVNNAGQYMESNRKSVAEIIKFLNGDSSTIQKLFNDFGDSEDVFSAFMKVSATPNYALPDANTLKFLISKINGLTELESKTFAKIIEVYSGNYYYLEDLIKTVNTKDRKLSPDSSKAFGRFIFKLDSYTTGNYVVNTDSFNLTDRSSYSLNPKKNKFSAFLDLYRIAMCQFPNKDPSFSDFVIDPVEDDDYFGDKVVAGIPLEINQENNKKKKRNLEILFNIVNAILDQDFSVLFAYSSDEEDKQRLLKVLKVLNLLDGKSSDAEKIENDFQTLQVVCALKPNKLKSSDDVSVPDCATQFKKANIIYLPDFVENKTDIESKIASLVMGMQHWNIVEILKGLEGSQNKEIFTLFQSFYIWKNLGFLLTNWSSLEERGKDQIQDLSKLIGLSLKGFLGKVLQTVTIINEKKEKKKAKVKFEPGSEAKKEEEKIKQDPLDKDLNYKALVDLVCGGSVKFDHKMLDLIEGVQNDEKEDTSNPHYLEWMLSLSKIYTGISDDPISKFEQFFTGRFIKRYIVGQKSNSILRYLFEFSMESYKILYNRVDPKNSKKANPEEMNDPLQPIKILPSLVTYFPHLGKDNEKLKTLLKVVDLFIRLFVVLQKKQPKKGTNDELTLVSLGVFKIVFVSLKVPKEKLIFDIINVLTGYDLTQDSISPKPSDKRQVKLFEILEETLFQHESVKGYINKDVLISLDEILQSLLSFKVKSLTDQKFLSDVLKLLNVISGTEKKEESTKKIERKEKKDKGDVDEIEKPKRKALIELPMKEIDCIFRIIQGDLTKIDVLIQAIDSDPQKVKMIQTAINDFQKLGVFSGKGLPNMGSLFGGKKSAPDNEMAELMKKIQSGKASVHELFIAVDKEGDSSGSISKQEFDSVAKKLNINLTKHRINEIFASIKKGSGNSNEEELNEEEFGKAMKYLNDKNTFMALDFLGISKGMLIIALIGLMTILLMLFVFIFLGIKAFAVGGGFGAVINSLMPMAAGAGVGGQKDEEKGKKVKDDNLGGAVAKTKTIIQSDKI